MLAEASAPRVLTTDELFHALRAGNLVLDTRPAEQFAYLHIRGSIQISLAGHFASWAAIVVNPAQELILIVEDAKRALEAYNRLARVGLGHVIGYSLFDEQNWRDVGLELASISIERSERIQRTLQSDPSLQLIDVRSRAEWLKGHLPGAVSMPLLDLAPGKKLIDPSSPSLVYCNEGFRATTAASILLRDGGGEISILVDGIEGWSALGLPLEVPQRGSE
jgi:rhodanese-related sulfurtransferase